jgi:hypothetical protein
MGREAGMMYGKYLPLAGEHYVEFGPINDIMSQTAQHVADQTIKADAGKEQLRLVPMQIMRDIAVVREYGNNKYKDPESWKRVDPNRYLDAFMRHAIAFIEDPLSVDEESGIPHLKHIACNVAFLSWFFKEGAFDGKNK